MSVVHTGVALHSSGSSPKTVSIQIGSGSGRKLIVAAIIYDSNPAAHSATLDPTGVNTAMTALAGNLYTDTGGNGYCIGIWYLDDANLPAAGTYDVRVTWTLVDTRISLVAYYLEGEASGAPAIYTDYQSTLSTIYSHTVSALSTDTVIDFVIGSSNFGDSTPDSPQTEVLDYVNTYTFLSSYADGETTMGWTGAKDEIWFSVVAIVSAAAASGVTEELQSFAVTNSVLSIDTIAATIESLNSFSTSAILQSIDLSASGVVEDLSALSLVTTLLDIVDIAEVSEELVAMTVSTTLESVETAAAVILDLLSTSHDIALLDITPIAATVLELLTVVTAENMQSIELIAATAIELQNIIASATLQAIDLSAVGNSEELQVIAETVVFETIEVIEATVLALEVLSETTGLLDVEDIQEYAVELTVLTIVSTIQSIAETQAVNYELLSAAFTHVLQAITITQDTTTPVIETVTVRAMIRDMVQ